MEAGERGQGRPGSRPPHTGGRNNPTARLTVLVPSSDVSSGQRLPPGLLTITQRLQVTFEKAGS